MTRLHPFDHAFGTLAEGDFPTIRSEAIAQHRDTADRLQFAALPTVQRTLQYIEDPDLLQAHPTAVAEYIAALFVAFNFWDHDRCTLTLTRPALEATLSQGPDRLGDPPEDTHVYLQLPEQLFWAQIDPESPHEPVDGVFLSSNSGTREIVTLAPLGLRADRPGFSQISVIGSFDDLATLAVGLRRPLFEPTVEGGAAAGLKSLTTGGELLALTMASLRTTIQD